MSTQNTTRIVAAVLDTQNLVLYKPDGQTIKIPQGDSRIRPILDKVTPGITAQGYFDLDIPDMVQENAFGTFEKKGGITRFFKVAKSMLNRVFNLDTAPVEPVSVGAIPQPQASEAQLAKAVEEIMAHAVPASSPDFTTENVLAQRPIADDHGVTPSRDAINEEENHSHTVVAVVNNQIVPGVEKLTKQIVHAAATNTKGMDAFLTRCASVAGQRKHSVEDLLRFMERGDLPIAEDGSILIYKVLRKKGTHYVDCHTQKVPQKVGSYVCMDEKLVDSNRRNECSNGLHVARRGYVQGFHGDVCVLAKLSPEDVIAVPDYDANKMRVCGYHIIFELTDEMYNLLKKNKPITEIEAGRVLLAKALAGNHIGITEEVRITGQLGTGVVITPKDKAPEQPTAVKKPELSQAVALDEVANGVITPPVSPKEVAQEVVALSRKDTAKGLYESFVNAKGTVDEQDALQALLDFKKSCKVGWERLGIHDPIPTPVKAQPVKASAESNTKTQVKTKPEGKPMTPREEIQHLLPKFEQATGQAKIDFAHDILKLKQQAKKSWDVLGVPKATVDKIILRTK